MSYNAAAHAQNTKRIAALLSKGRRVAVVAASTGQPASRVEQIRQVLDAARRGVPSSSIAASLRVSVAVVRRIRAALGVTATKADGGRMTRARRGSELVSAIATTCPQCGQLTGAVHTAEECADVIASIAPDRRRIRR